MSSSERGGKEPPFWSKPEPFRPQLLPPRARPASSHASQLSHRCGPNPFSNERLARPSLSRRIEWLRWVVWTNGEGVELQTEWKWPRETKGDTERETEMEGGTAPAYAAPTHLTSPCCHIYVFATMVLRWITMWPTSEHPGLGDKIKQISFLDSSHHTINRRLLGSLLRSWCAPGCLFVNVCMQMCVSRLQWA